MSSAPTTEPIVIATIAMTKCGCDVLVLNFAGRFDVVIEDGVIEYGRNTISVEKVGDGWKPSLDVRRVVGGNTRSDAEPDELEDIEIVGEEGAKVAVSIDLTKLMMGVELESLPAATVFAPVCFCVSVRTRVSVSVTGGDLQPLITKLKLPFIITYDGAELHCVSPFQPTGNVGPNVAKVFSSLYPVVQF